MIDLVYELEDDGEAESLAVMEVGGALRAAREMSHPRANVKYMFDNLEAGSAAGPVPAASGSAVVPLERDGAGRD